MNACVLYSTCCVMMCCFAVSGCGRLCQGRDEESERSRGEAGAAVSAGGAGGGVLENQSRSAAHCTPSHADATFISDITI